MTEEQAKKLREPFPASAVGKLPKPTKKENPKGKCDVCGGYHGLPAVHLDYVGHAATTDRLLHVDPEWTWEPMAYGPSGEPQFTNGGLWIWLTVAGVRRPGFGDGASPKEIIGDAIRNAAMRFGVALDLWAKEDLHGEDGAEPVANDSPFQPPQTATKAEGGITAAQNKKLGVETTEWAKSDPEAVDKLRAFLANEFGKTSRAALTSKEASQTIEWVLNQKAGLVPAGQAADSDIPFSPTAHSAEV